MNWQLSVERFFRAAVTRPGNGKECPQSTMLDVLTLLADAESPDPSRVW
jgi:hypothetical protein